MYLITPSQVRPMAVIWGDDPHAYFLNRPNKKYPLIRPFYDWKLLGYPEPYFLVFPESTNCEPLYSEYKSFCDWTPDLSPGKLQYHYELISHQQKHCADLRAKHLVNCRSKMDRGHIGAIMRAKQLMDVAQQRMSTARPPANLEEKIEETLGQFSVIDYDEGPQYSVTDRLLELPHGTLLDFANQNECLEDIPEEIFDREITDLTKRELVYLLLEYCDFWPLIHNDG